MKRKTRSLMLLLAVGAVLATMAQRCLTTPGKPPGLFRDFSYQNLAGTRSEAGTLIGESVPRASTSLSRQALVHIAGGRMRGQREIVLRGEIDAAEAAAVGVLKRGGGRRRGHQVLGVRPQPGVFSCRTPGFEGFGSRLHPSALEVCLIAQAAAAGVDGGGDVC